MNFSLGSSSFSKADMDFYRRRNQLNRGVPYSLAVDIKETRVLEGSKLRLFVLSDRSDPDDEPVGYRLRPVPIDPMQDYSATYEDFDIMEAERYGKPAWNACYDKFNEENEIFDRILQQTRPLK